MIIIVEGIDRVGKTTFIDKLCEKMPNLFRFKDSNICSKKYSSNDFSSFSLGKLDTSVSMLKQLSDKGLNVVVDRLHLTELVYGEVERGAAEYKEIYELDKILSEMKTLLVLVQPTDLQWSNKEAEKDQTEHYNKFREAYSNSAIEKYHTNFNELDEMVEIIINRMSLNNAKTASQTIAGVVSNGVEFANTLEMIDVTSSYSNITTEEILRTFKIDKSLSMNFVYDIKNKISSKYGPYLIEKYHDIFDKVHDIVKYVQTDSINSRRFILQFEQEHCFQYIQFLIRNNKLIVICNMRSCNAIDNYRPDVYICSLIADEFADSVRRQFNINIKQTYDIIFHVGSLHVFKEEGELNASK